MIKTMLSFGMAEGVSLAVNWLLILILAMFMSAENYGVISLIIAIESFILPMMVFGQDRTILRFHKNSEFEGQNVLLASIYIVIASFFLFYMLSYVDFFTKYLDRIHISNFKSILMVSIILLVIIKLYMAVLRVEGNSRQYVINRLGHQVLRAILVLAFIFYFNDAEYYLLASFLSALFLVLFQLKGWKERLKGVLNQQLFNRILMFGWPLVFHSMSAIALTYIDRFMIESYMGVSSVGNYSLAYMLGSGISLIYGLIAIYFEPYIYKQGKDSGSEVWLGLYTKVSIVFVSIGGIISLLISIVLFKYYFVDEYTDAFEIIPMVLMAHIFNSIFFQSNYRLAIIEKTGVIASGTVIAASLNIVLNMVLIPKIGLQGAALATFFSYMFLSIYLYIQSCVKSGLDFSEQNNLMLYVFIEISLLVSVLMNSQGGYFTVLILLLVVTCVNLYKYDFEIIKINFTKLKN